MPTYHVQHLTHYTYEEPVPICHNLAHLRPRDSMGHEWLSSRIDIQPLPAIRDQRRDYFGNWLTFFAIQESHRDLRVTSTATVRVTPSDPTSLLPPSTISWEQALRAFDVMGGNDFQRRHSLDAYQFIFDSPFVHGCPEVTAYAARLLFSGPIAAGCGG